MSLQKLFNTLAVFSVLNAPSAHGFEVREGKMIFAAPAGCAVMPGLQNQWHADCSRRFTEAGQYLIDKVYRADRLKDAGYCEKTFKIRDADYTAFRS